MPTSSQPRRRGGGGAPRKIHHRTGANPAFARAIASGLPGVASTRGRGRTAFAVQEQRFLTVNEESATVTTAPGDEHTYELTAVGRDELRSAIEGAWESYAPRRSVTSYRKQQDRRAAQPAVTHEDVRRVILRLPGAAEGPIWGSDIGFLIGTEKKTRFARFGPPIAGRVGNLLPPDDEDTLVIFYCEQKPELLASCAERFFTTPHYGGPDEPGGVITRLSENRGKAELEELAELLEDAWREVATPELIAQLDGKRKRT